MTDRHDRHDSAELRLRAADPAGPSRPLPPPRRSRAELIEDIMTTTEASPAPPAAPKPTRTRWVLAAAAAVVAASVATAVALTTGDDSGAPVAAHKTVKHLALPASNAMTSCVMFSVDILRDMPVAFSGTVAKVTDTDVLIDVDHWYKGGSADQVELANNNADGVMLENGFRFEQGHRYLVTASDGTVNSCGFTMEWSAEMEQAFQEAYGS